MLPAATFAGAGRGGQGPPRTTAPPKGDSGRGREGKSTTEAPATDGAPTAHAKRSAARSLEGGNRGRKSRVGRPGPRACPRADPPRPPRASPQGPAPVPTPGTGLRRVASGDTVPREHAHAPGTTSPSTRAGAVCGQRLPIGTPG